jgi:hypothetical protein
MAGNVAWKWAAQMEKPIERESSGTSWHPVDRSSRRLSMKSQENADFLRFAQDRIWDRGFAPGSSRIVSYPDFAFVASL